MIETEHTLIDKSDLDQAVELINRLRDSLGRMILGQEDLINLTIYGILARGHILLEGLPGLGKTELVKSLSSLLQLDFTRIQFTPDLLPSDITGAPILQEDDQGKREFQFQEGPLFSNLVLADEINRASPKTQSAMLEAMQERHITVLGCTRPLPTPFFVLATQNPIELEGTYPLPEAQLDRFLFKINVTRLETSVLSHIISTRHHGKIPTLEAALTKEELFGLFDLVDRIYLPTAVADYIARLVNATHPGIAENSDANELIKFGASPRAAIAIAEAARARALCQGRPGIGFEDVKVVARPALNHRMILQYRAKLDGLQPEDVVNRILDSVDETAKPLPKGLVDA